MIGKYIVLDPFKDFHFNFPHRQGSKNGRSRLIKKYA